MRKSYKAMLAAICLVWGAAALPTVAPAGVFFDVRVAPPPRIERAPPPRRGYHWVPDRWVPVGPRCRYARGHWER